MKHIHLSAVLFASLSTWVACDSGKSDSDYQSDIVVSIHSSIDDDLANLVQGAKDLQTAAPTHAWDATTDAAAITAMITAWKTTRVAYEHVEGATAPLFGGLDTTMDARYDDFLTPLAPTGDQDLFDDTGVTGMHGIERILFAPTIRQEVIDFEKTLPGYKAAAFPATDAEAMEFKTKLAQKLIDDANTLHDSWAPNVGDLAQAYQGLVSLMNEQKEKVNLAATGEEESRYANITLFDLRNNLEGTQKVYDLFQPWIQSKSAGKPADTTIQAKFTTLGALYNQTPGDALPAVPGDWSNDMPTPANLMTPFGMLWDAVHQDVDPSADGSVVFEMNKIAVALGYPQFVEE
ncbi:MAG TPA: EfeM/EfeO family lipoprotein [Kofleriaceae bacterium]|jgi:iron uptake system component EfeO|nr:EfeM/EfeO family lipoprotein [Kofleriaceae bacterium]